MKVETYLPLFPGFYGTSWEAYNEEDEISEINRIREGKGLEPITWDDCQWNYMDRDNEVAQNCCHFIEERIKEMGLDIDINYQKINSPKYYNFSNDSIYIEADIRDFEKIINYLNDNEEEFEEYIGENYTSRSGFLSSYSNNHKVWMLDLKDHENTDIGHRIGSVLNFILINEEITEQDMYDYVSDMGDGSLYVWANNYEELTELNKTKQL